MEQDQLSRPRRGDQGQWRLHSLANGRRSQCKCSRSITSWHYVWDAMARPFLHFFNPTPPVRCKLDMMSGDSWALRFCIRPLNGALLLLAIMDIRYFTK
jgi:hypothetical protein